MLLLVFVFLAGIMGLQHPGVLVYGAAWAEPPVSGLDLWGPAQMLLDDRLLQPSGLPDSDETGTRGNRLPTYLPSVGEETRWRTEGEAGTHSQLHSKHMYSYTHTNINKQAWIPICVNVRQMKTAEKLFQWLTLLDLYSKSSTLLLGDIVFCNIVSKWSITIYSSTIMFKNSIRKHENEE